MSNEAKVNMGENNVAKQTQKGLNMRTDTLTCSYQMDTTSSTFFSILLGEQEKFFLAKHLTTSIGEGCQIETMIQTKSAPQLVPAVMTVKKITADELWINTVHEEGVIDQRYQVTSQKNGKLQVTYSEQSHFARQRTAYSFMLVALFYKFFFNEISREPNSKQNSKHS